MVNDKTFQKAKRVFWFFIFFSAFLWLIPFLIRIFFIDFDIIEPIPKIVVIQKTTVVSQISQQLVEGNKFYAFGLVFWNNLKVCIISIVGAAMFGIATVYNLVQNGFYTGDVMINIYESGLPINEILKHTLPHSIELFGFWLSGAIGFSLVKIIIDFIRTNTIPSKRFVVFLGKNAFLIFLTILLASYIEVYISISKL